MSIKFCKVISSFTPTLRTLTVIGLSHRSPLFLANACLLPRVRLENHYNDFKENKNQFQMVLSKL